MESIRILAVDNLVSACDFLTKMVDDLGFHALGVTEHGGFLSNFCCQKLESWKTSSKNNSMDWIYH